MKETDKEMENKEKGVEMMITRYSFPTPPLLQAQSDDVNMLSLSVSLALVSHMTGQALQRPDCMVMVW